MFPYFGWLIAGWLLTWAAVELAMFQRLLDTVSLTGAQWLLVLALSLLAPGMLGVEKVIRVRRGNGSDPGEPVQRSTAAAGTAVTGHA